MENVTKVIDKTVVGKIMPKNPNTLWLDTTEGEKSAVLKYKGNPVVGSGGGSTNPGYNVTKQTVTLFNDTIETQESGGIYQGVVENIDFTIVAGETYTVVFDGVSYDVKAITAPFSDECVILGEFDDGPSFETYPFAILYTEQEGVKSFILATNIEGSHTVVIKHEEKTVTTTPEFKDAVDSVTGYSIEEGYETICIENEIQAAQGSTYQFDSSFNLVIGDSYKVTFDGTEYQCICYANGYLNAIGEVYNSGYQWNEYPFSIDELGGTVMGNFQTGTHNIKIEHLTTSTKTTPEFQSLISTKGVIVSPFSEGGGHSPYYIYKELPEAGNIYLMPYYSDVDGSRYEFLMLIENIKEQDGVIGGTAKLLGSDIIYINVSELGHLSIGSTINSQSSNSLGIVFSQEDGGYKVFYSVNEVGPA